MQPQKNNNQNPSEKPQKPQEQSQSQNDNSDSYFESAQEQSQSHTQSQQQVSSSVDPALQAALEQLQNQLQQDQQNQQDCVDASDSQQQLSSQPPADHGQQQQSTVGCAHYLRNCDVEAPCCKIYYTCKLCHDEKYQGPKSKNCKVQRMEFEKVQNIKCKNCSLVQTPSLKCVNPECQITFGKYACLKCKLYENRNSKKDDIFHCDQCGMCRRGKVQHFFHCKMCGYCRPNHQKNNHRCSQNSGQSKCPICLEVLKYSTKYYIPIKCGHLIHVDCLKQYNQINCPVCGMAIQKLSNNQNTHIDQMIQNTKNNLPEEVKNMKVNVLCNQCLHKSFDVPFHYFGIKCAGCGTYNTKMI